MGKYNIIIDDVKSKEFEFETVNGTIQVEVAFLPSDELDKIVTASTKTKWKRNQPQEILETKKFRKKLFKSTICNIKGATIKHFNCLLEPYCHIAAEGDAQKEIAFDNDLLDILVNYCHLEFQEFILERAREVTSFYEKESNQEKANLKLGSGGSKAKKDTQ